MNNVKISNLQYVIDDKHETSNLFKSQCNVTINYNDENDANDELTLIANNVNDMHDALMIFYGNDIINVNDALLNIKEI